MHAPSVTVTLRFASHAILHVSADHQFQSQFQHPPKQNQLSQASQQTKAFYQISVNLYVQCHDITQGKL